MVADIWTHPSFAKLSEDHPPRGQLPSLGQMLAGGRLGVPFPPMQGSWQAEASSEASGGGAPEVGRYKGALGAAPHCLLGIRL